MSNKSEDKRTSVEKGIRNCVFMLVIVYVASLTWLFLNSQINMVNAESDLVSANLMASVNLVNTGSSSTDTEEVVVEDTELVDVEMSESDLVESEFEL